MATDADRERWRRYEARHREERNKPRGDWKARSKRYHARHPEVRSQSEARRRADPAERAADAIHRKLRHIISGSFKSDITDLGYNWQNLRRHIKAQFLPGMSWRNYGKWHIDHIKPRSEFNLPDEMLECFALENLRPLWATDNVSHRRRPSLG